MLTRPKLTFRHYFCLVIQCFKTLLPNNAIVPISKMATTYLCSIYFLPLVYIKKQVYNLKTVHMSVMRNSAQNKTPNFYLQVQAAFAVGHTCRRVWSHAKGRFWAKHTSWSNICSFFIHIRYKREWYHFGLPRKTSTGERQGGCNMPSRSRWRAVWKLVCFSRLGIYTQSPSYFCPSKITGGACCVPPGL